MTADNRSGIRKIAVAFDPGCAAPALLEAAIDLAISLGADLEALLVDDPDIVRMSQLPFGRIFDLHTGKAAIFDKRAVQTRRAGSLALARATMRRTAERRRVFCSVRELPGIGLIDATLKETFPPVSLPKRCRRCRSAGRARGRHSPPNCTAWQSCRRGPGGPDRGRGRGA